jgi:hypothetical protein
MAKSDLLKEAIADAKAVKETALANAKIALEEAFQPRIKNMLENELMNELEHEDMEDEMDMEPAGDDMEMDVEADTDEPMEVGDVSIDTDMDGDVDFTGDIVATAPAAEEEEADVEMADDMDAEDDLDLAEIIRELEEDMDEGMHEDEMEETMHEGMHETEMEEGMHETEMEEDMYESTNESIDKLIEAILAEEEDEVDEGEKEKADEMAHGDKKKDEALVSSDIGKGGEPSNDSSSNAIYEAELQEAYNTVKHLKSVINEVNLLNAKLLYTNKLFRNFELSETQKMKVIENFDRAANTREAKLVFSTLAESFQKPSAGKKMVKESKSMASRPVGTTAPSKETTQVLTEGFEQANRWKKLAGLK